MRGWSLRINIRLAYQPALKRWPRLQFSVKPMWHRDPRPAPPTEIAWAIDAEQRAKRRRP